MIRQSLFPGAKRSPTALWVSLGALIFALVIGSCEIITKNNISKYCYDDNGKPLVKTTEQTK